MRDTLIARVLRNEDNEIVRAQSLKEHSDNVAYVASKLSECVGLSAAGKLAGYLHDAGKAKAAFQSYIAEEDAEKRDRMRGSVIHSRAGALYLQMLIDDMAAKGMDVDTPMIQMTREVICMAIVSHHTGLIDPFGIEGEDCLDTAIHQCETEDTAAADTFFATIISRDEASALFREAISEITTACSGVDIQSLKMKYAEDKQSKQCYMLSLRSFLIEYIASCIVEGDRLDAQCFEEGRHVELDGQISVSIWAKYLKALEEHIARFPAGGTISAMRRKLSDNCSAAAGNPIGIYSLWAPTGFGKTLASLRFALGHAVAHHASRIFYIIPYMSIIDQTAKEFKSFLPEGAVLEHHSNFNVGDMKEDELSQYELATQSWTSPIIMTTMVQFLDTVFSMRNTNLRRLHSLANSVIIFDEIQNLPTRCMLPFFQLCEFLKTTCHCTIVLCSATQPRLDDAKLYLKLISNGDIGGLTNEDAEAMQRTEIVDIREKGKLDATALVDLVLVQEARSALIVHNTKSAAAKTFHCLGERAHAGASLYFLTTDLCPAHRMDIITSIKEKLKEKSDERVYIVSTQLIEAGVDISADVAFRSLAGLDSIIQTAGRCNRNGGDGVRPVYVFESAEENLSHLIEIKDAQQDYTNTFEYCRRKGLPLMSQEAISHYYSIRNYRFEASPNVNGYPMKVDSVRTTITEGLYPCNGNPCYASAKDHQRNGIPLISYTPFRSIGNQFRVIDNASQISVIVPYKGKRGEDCTAESIIKRLQNDYLGKDELKRLLKTAQQYTVNVFVPQDKIPSNIYEKNGIFFAAEYGEVTGLRLKEADGSAIIL